MGAYENPRYIDPTGAMRAITNGLIAFAAGNMKNINEYKKLQEAQQQKSNKIINKEIASGQAKLNTEYMEAKGQLEDFTAGLGTKDPETGEMTQAVDAPLIKEQIGGILDEIGTELNNKIETIQKEGGGVNEIRKATNDAILEMENFSKDMVQWEVGRKQYMNSQGKNPNEIGALLTNQSNPQMIEMYNAAVDRKAGNIWITRDPNTKHARVSLGNFTDDGKDFDVYSTMDMTAWTAETAEKGQLFDEVTDDPIDYDVLMKTIKEDDRFKSKSTGLNEKEIRDYFMNTDMGKTMMNDYLMNTTQVRGQWRRLASASEVQKLNNTNGWNVYDDSFTDEAFLWKVLDGTIDRLYQEGSMYTRKQRGEGEEEEEELTVEGILNTAYGISDVEEEAKGKLSSAGNIGRAAVEAGASLNQ